MIIHFLFLRRSCLFLLFFVDALPPPSSNLALTYYHHKCTKSKQNSYNHFFEFHTWIFENVQVVKHMWSNDLLHIKTLTLTLFQNIRNSSPWRKQQCFWANAGVDLQVGEEPKLGLIAETTAGNEACSKLYTKALRPISDELSTLGCQQNPEIAAWVKM